MSEVEVFFNIKEEVEDEKVNEELNWYDIIKQEMLVFYGGKLAFRYKEDPYLVKMGATERSRRGIKSVFRMLPEVEDIVIKNYFKKYIVTNQNEIESWFKSSEYVEDVTVENITDQSIIFEVPENMKNDFCQDIEEMGFIL